MPVRALLDTNVVSEIMRNPSGSARHRLDDFGSDDVAISIITLCELRFGAEWSDSAKYRRQNELLLLSMPVLLLDRPVDEHYGRIRAELARAGRPIGPNDLLIAAHALALDVMLVTGNVREFSRVSGLRVESWLD